MIYDGKGPVKMMESAKATKSASKKEDYWAGVGRRFKMDWEYSKPTILGSLTGSIVIVALFLFLAGYAFEDTFFVSVLLALLILFVLLAGSFFFRYMIPEKRFDEDKTTFDRKNFNDNLHLTEQKLIEEEKLRNAMSIINKLRGR